MTASPDDVQRPVPTREFWHPRGEWKCVCTTPTHKRGQRFTCSQCQYCERVVGGVAGEREPRGDPPS